MEQKFSPIFLKKFSAKFKKVSNVIVRGIKLGFSMATNWELVFVGQFCRFRYGNKIETKKVAGFTPFRWLPIEGINIFSESCPFYAISLATYWEDKHFFKILPFFCDFAAYQLEGQIYTKVQKSRLLAGYHLEGLLFSKKFGSNDKKVPN